jgi:hypothetical protein
MARTAVLTTDKEVRDIVKMRNQDGMNWTDIAAHYGVSQGRAMFAYKRGTIELLPGMNEKTIPKTIVKLRHESNSWADIAVMVGVAEGRAMKIWEDTTGEPSLGNRIGKGGAPVGSRSNGQAPVKAGATKKVAAKATKATAKAATGSKVAGLVASGDLGKVKAFLDGYVIQVDTGSGPKAISVAEVTKLKGDVITLKDGQTGRTRAVKVGTITGRGKARSN